MKAILISFLVGLSMLVSAYGIGQEEVRVHLLNSEVLLGQLILINTDFLLLSQQSNTIRIERDEVLYVSRNRVITYEPPKLTLNPIAKNWTTEVQSGITVISPLALRADLNIWRKLTPRASIGFGPSLHFFRFTSMNAGLRFKFSGRPGRYIRPLAEAGASISFYEVVSGVNFAGSFWGTQIPPNYSADFTRIKQIEFGPGIYMDTGLGVAFTSKILFNATWFSITEQPNQGFQSVSDFEIFTLSLLGGFIF